MALTRRERRELRKIEQALSVSDPTLAALLSAAGTDTGRLPRIVSETFVAVSVLLIIAGLVLGDSGMLVGGFLVIMSMPPVVLLIAVVENRQP